MDTEDVRFGFVVDEDTAKKFYAFWNCQRETENLKTTMTDVFRSIVNIAFATVPEAYRDLERIRLAKRKSEQEDG